MVKNFIVNVLLLFIWILLTGDMSLGNLIFGYSLGFAILWVISRQENDKRYFTRIPEITLFIFSYFGTMIRANISVVTKVLSRKIKVNPAIIRYPMELKSDFEITVLSNLISLTPGTLVLDVSEDRKYLYIHVMDLSSKEHFIKTTKNKIEKKILNILR